MFVSCLEVSKVSSGCRRFIRIRGLFFVFSGCYVVFDLC